MGMRLLRRPACNFLYVRSHYPTNYNAIARRSESTFQRTKKRLNIKPESAFVFSKFSPRQDHIIFNPPSSTPSVLHTPLKFLPRDDRRRQLLSNSSSSTLGSSSSPLPPPVLKSRPGVQRHHLSEEDVAEIRRLRTADPDTWSATKLARKFNCSTTFIGICCEAPKAKLEAEKAKLEALRARWGPKRTMAREDRVKRKEALFRDE